MAITITSDNFLDLTGGEQPVMIDFWAPWCGPCRMVGPSIDRLAETYADRAVVGKLNVDDESGIAQRYRVMSIPTVMIFKAGQPVETVVGARSYDDLESLLKKHLG
ncbi:MAG: thioredoxin [Clostridia bacterium]|nr:thioredoxin [Clostridia bacterium]